MKEKKLKRLVKGYIYLDRIKRLPSSYDIIGHVAIIEVPKELQKHKKTIAKALMETNKKIETVLEKKSERKGKYRNRKYMLLAGKRKTETVHKEYGCTFKLDPTKVYFSPRELTERQRIAEQVKPNESILIPFSGIAPLPIIIAKKQSKIKKIYAIEINPKAHKYALENIRINKISDKINLYLGDVSKVCPTLKKKFDRIVMPLPIEGYKFLDMLLPYLKNKGIIHFYYLASEADLFTDARKLIKDIASKFNKKFRILHKNKVLRFSPRKWKIALDVLFSS